MDNTFYMEKIISSDMFPDDFHPTFDVIESHAKFCKTASDVGVSFDSADLKPPAGFVPLHVIALGGFERYGFNRNGDAFPKEACVKYHPTFVSHGHIYEHHRNTDPAKALGFIKASAWNEPMQRIELFLHVDEKKAAEHLDKLHKEGETSHSMACKVAFDRCDACGYVRKSKKSEDWCEHKQMLGKTASDGTFNGVHNDEPTFFDISFVSRPADRIAWSLKAASGSISYVDSVTMAKQLGVSLPSEDYFSKKAALLKLAEYEAECLRLNRGLFTANDYTVDQFRKMGSGITMTENEIARARVKPLNDLFYTFSVKRAFMDPVTFLKFAMGDQYSADDAKSMCAVLSKGFAIKCAANMKMADAVCNDSIFDFTDRDCFGIKKAALDVSIRDFYMDKLANFNTDFDIRQDYAILSDNEVGVALAKKYMAYKVAALKDTMDDWRVCLVAAAQNLCYNRF